MIDKANTVLETILRSQRKRLPLLLRRTRRARRYRRRRDCSRRRNNQRNDARRYQRQYYHNPHSLRTTTARRQPRRLLPPRLALPTRPSSSSSPSNHSPTARKLKASARLAQLRRLPISVRNTQTENDIHLFLSRHRQYKSTCDAQCKCSTLTHPYIQSRINTSSTIIAFSAHVRCCWRQEYE